MAVFPSRQIVMPVAPPKVVVTITGIGNKDYCYATIGGTKCYGSGTYELEAGDTITFGVYGRSSAFPGHVTIDGTEVLRVTTQGTETYTWTVPNGISTVEIAMTVMQSPRNSGNITVTTA